MPPMKIWGMLSVDDEKSGFDLVLDENWYVSLFCKKKLMARFDPRDYTSVELQKEVDQLIQAKNVGASKGKKAK